MKLLIVSGMSGSGKSTVLHALEDLGYYCVDNLPIALIGRFIGDMLDRDDGSSPGVVIGIDARSPVEDLEHFSEHMQAIHDPRVECEMLFLDADDEVLLKRFSETRRKHPLSRGDTPLAEAIQRERKLLDPFASSADLRLDTSRTNLHQLREMVIGRLAGFAEKTMLVLFESFGFKHGPPSNADFVFDLRCLPNPHWQDDLRPLTGRDQGVIDFLESKDSVEQMFGDIAAFLSRWIPRFETENRSYLTVAVGCTGGQHRSVYMAERLTRHFQALGLRAQVRHREQS